MEITFNIPVQSLYETYRYLNKLQKRVKKAGQPVVFTFAFDDEVKSHSFEAHTEQGDLVASYKYRVLRVNQDITIYEGWTPIAKLDIGTKQMKAYSVYNKEIETLGDKLWTKHCDHCGHNKIVHTAFVMQNGDKFMKVGKGCMKELAPVSAAQIAKEFDIYSLWSDYLNMMTAPEGSGMSSGSRGFGSGISVEYVYSKSDLILAMRAALECTDGKWVTSKYTENNRSYYGPDSQRIINMGFRTFDFIQRFLNNQVCMIPDQKYVDSVHADIDLCLSKYPHLIIEEKLAELKVFAAAEKARAIDIFLIRTVQGIIEREAKKDLMRVSEYQGAVGAKVPLILEFVSEKHGQSAYGGWTLTIFKDHNGNMYKKFGSVPDRFKTDSGAYQFTAPIKGFETYDDIKYTVLGGPLSKFKVK